MPTDRELTVPDVSREESDEIFSAVSRGEPWSGSFTVRHRDGSTFRALVTTAGVCNACGQVVGLVGCAVRRRWGCGR